VFCALHAGWVLFAFCTFWCCALLMPINGTAGFLVSCRDSSCPHFFSQLHSHNNRDSSRSSCSCTNSSQTAQQLECRQRLEACTVFCNMVHQISGALHALTHVCCQLHVAQLSTFVMLLQASLPPTPATSDLDLLSTSNVPQGSHRMWAHLISAYVVSLVALLVSSCFCVAVALLVNAVHVS
jgi:hypothetical protein